MEIEVLKLIINLDVVLGRDAAAKIRGYLGKIFWDNPIVHHHIGSNTLIYGYPVVQYKIINGECFLIGFLDGIDVLKKTFLELKGINLDGRWQEVIGKALESCVAKFGIAGEPIPYTFLTPWLALNEENYQRYQRFGSWKKRRELLVKVLVGNILAVAKGIGYTVPAPIAVEIRRLRPTRAKLKGVPMLGFLGEFTVNFAIPDYWGLGKSVARGFGTIARLE